MIHIILGIIIVALLIWNHNRVERLKRKDLDKFDDYF